MEPHELIEKIKRLPPERIAEVQDFVDSLARRDTVANETSLQQAISEYAIQHAGSGADLDPELEPASIDHLLQENTQP